MALTVYAALKYTGYCSPSVSWKQGYLRLEKEKGVWKCNIQFNCNRKSLGKTLKLTDQIKSLPTAEGIIRKGRFFIELFNGTTINIKDSNVEKILELKTLLLQIKNGNANAKLSTQASPLTPKNGPNVPMKQIPVKNVLTRNEEVISGENGVGFKAIRFHGRKSYGGNSSSIQGICPRETSPISRKRSLTLSKSTSLKKLRFGDRSSFSSQTSLSSPPPTSNDSFPPSSSSSTVIQPQTPEIVGFPNLGNTCYMNAILQVLLDLDVFTHDILASFNLSANCLAKFSILRCLVQLLYARHQQISVEEARLVLQSFKKAISAKAEQFSGDEQNDAHEFMGQLLAQLVEDVDRVLRSTLSPSYNPINLNFEFELVHTITCTNCGEKVISKEKIRDLSVDVPKMSDPSIQDAIDRYFHKEEIDYSCNSCSNKKSCLTHKITQLPRVLIVHIKRYIYDRVVFTNHKTSKNVIIPKYLTLDSHCTEETHNVCPVSYYCYFSSCSLSLRNSTVVNPSISRRRLSYCIGKDASESELSNKNLKINENEIEHLGVKLLSSDNHDNLQMNHTSKEMLTQVIDMSKKDTKVKDGWSLNSQHLGQTSQDNEKLSRHIADANEENKENEFPGGLNDFKTNHTDTAEQHTNCQEDNLKDVSASAISELEEGSGEEDNYIEERSEEYLKRLKINYENGNLPHSYRLVGVVSHLGASSTTGHYVSDAHNFTKDIWNFYDDERVSEIAEKEVQTSRERTGYLFFYVHRDVLAEMKKKQGHQDSCFRLPPVETLGFANLKSSPVQS